MPPQAGQEGEEQWCYADLKGTWLQPSDKKLIIKDIHVLPKKDITGSKEYAKAAQAAAAEVVVLDPLYSAYVPDETIPAPGPRSAKRCCVCAGGGSSKLTSF